MRIARWQGPWPALICALLMAAQPGCRARGEGVELERAAGSPAFLPHWELLRPALLNDDTFYRIRITDSGERGWLAGRGGTLFQYVDSRWVRRADLPAAGKIALTHDGESGWGIGREGVVLRYQADQWRQDEAASRLAPEGLDDICLAADGRAGWAVGGQGTVLKYGADGWSRDAAAARLLGTTNLSQIWCSQDATAAWAAGGAAGTSRVIRLQDGVWRQDAGLLRPRAVWPASPSSALAYIDLLGLWRFDGKWSRVPAAVDDSLNAPFLSFWSSPDGSGVWLAGSQGKLVRRQLGMWYRDPQFGSLTSDGIHSLWLTPKESDGWAVGEHGTVVRFRPYEIGEKVRLEPVAEASITHLQGDFDLALPAPAYFPTAQLVNQADGTLEQLGATEIKARYLTADRRTLRLTLSAADRAGRMKGTKQALSLAIVFEHPTIPTVALFTSSPFTMVGPSAWTKAAFTALGVVLLNLLLFLGATRIRWLRTVALHPVGSAVFGLVLGKYLLTDWMIRFVRPLKLAMFSDYRRRLLASEAIARWQARPDPYVPPAVELAPPGAPAEGDPESAWERVFRTLLDSPRDRLWLVQGPSGLGKTALLEKWAGLALGTGRTPLLIALRRGPAKQEAAALMSQLGDVDVKDEVAFDLVTGGGFVLLLDALNEDRMPEATRDFVRQAAKRNLVVLTSQFDPGWNDVVDVRRIELREFGEAQLRRLLDAGRAAEILASRQLASIARLPVTANLLAQFVQRSGRLPADRLQIYDSLVAGLAEEPLLNLQEKAWTLFRSNELEFASDSGLPAEICGAAVSTGALTRRQGDRYRFSHEMVQRFLVAAYLNRRERRPLADWHHEIKAGLQRGHWIEVLDFWGEMWGARAVADPREIHGYEEFLREAAGFSRTIFAARLYPHYDSLCAAGGLAPNPELIAWAARLLAGAVREAPTPRHGAAGPAG
jgi:hypothetical protein